MPIKAWGQHYALSFLFDATGHSILRLEKRPLEDTSCSVINNELPGMNDLLLQKGNTILINEARLPKQMNIGAGRIRYFGLLTSTFIVISTNARQMFLNFCQLSTIKWSLNSCLFQECISWKYQQKNFFWGSDKTKTKLAKFKKVRNARIVIHKSWALIVPLVH